MRSSSTTFEKVFPVRLNPELLAPFVGGQVEIQNQGENYIYRGEIADITLTEKNVEVKFVWLAKGKGGYLPAGWEKDEKLDYTVDITVNSISDVGDGRISIRSPYTGETTLFFPAGGSKLDPARVEGLELAG